MVQDFAIPPHPEHNDLCVIASQMAPTDQAMAMAAAAEEVPEPVQEEAKVKEEQETEEGTNG